MRRLVLAVLASLILSGGAVASVFASSTHTPKPQPSDDRSERPEKADESVVRGGPIARFHGSGCTLTNVSGLAGNWTHGDYVSAVAQSGDPTLIVQAAHSDCGKPMVSVIHGLAKHTSKDGPPVGTPHEPGS
jgi:hypothetical protein